jgi:hypothetical protein
MLIKPFQKCKTGSFGNSLSCLTVVIFGASGFSTTLVYRCGLSNTAGSSRYEFPIGMDSSATDGLDRHLDSPAPPVPPEICYAWLLAPEGTPPFNVLWKDYRGISDFALWKIISTRNSGGGELKTQNLPDDYTIYIQGAKASLQNGILAFTESDSLMDIIAVKGKRKESCAIVTEKDIVSTKVNIVIHGKDKKDLETIEAKPEGKRLLTFTPKTAAGSYTYTIKAEGETVKQGRIIIASGESKKDK